MHVEAGPRKQVGNEDILRTGREERASFAEVQLLRAEYMMKAGAVSASDLYKIYMALRRLQVPSEDLFYRIALFCDGMLSQDPTNVSFICDLTSVFSSVPIWLELSSKHTLML